MKLNFAAPINDLGYGIVGFNLLKTFWESGAFEDFALWPIGPIPQEVFRQNEEIITAAMKGQERYDRNAPSFRHYHQFDLAQHIGRGINIGSTVFELNQLNYIEKHHLNSQDLICVPSEWAREVLKNSGVKTPSVILHHGVDRGIFNHYGARERKDNTTRFVNIGKWEIRKGHDVLVDIFNKAFTPKDNVHLTMACHNPFYSEEMNKGWVDLYKNSPLGDKITVYEGRFRTQQEIAQLMHDHDCGVFPSRAEGWGLESFEMMSVGKQVILTDYAGHTEYANNDNSLLIEVDELESAFDGVWFSGWAEWAAIGEAQIEQAVEHMRSVHKNKQEGALGLNIKGIETAKQFSWENAIQPLLDIIK